MNARTFDAVTASLLVHGHQTLTVADRPPPEGWVGQTVVIRADEVEPELGQVGTSRRWAVTQYDHDDSYELMDFHGQDSRLSLHPGHIVGSARLTATLPVIKPERIWPYLDAVGLTELPEEGVRMLVRRRLGHDYVSEHTNLSDQLPLVSGIRPGQWVWLWEGAAPCETRCPACQGRAHWRTTTMDRTCSTCYGRGSCAPIPHPGGDGDVWEWTP